MMPDSQKELPVIIVLFFIFECEELVKLFKGTMREATVLYDTDLVFLADTRV